MKTFFFLCVTLVVALAFDVIAGQIAGFLMPPLAVVVICYWLWRLDWGERLMLAFCSGIILDAIGFFPMGSHTFVLVALAFLCTPMKSFFSNTQSRFVTVLNVGLLIIVFRVLILPVSSLINFI